MKRLFTLIVLLGIVMSAALTGCEQKPMEESAAPDTNAVPAVPEMPSTNQ
jgi:predicted small lipoprotein YifL